MARITHDFRSSNEGQTANYRDVNGIATLDSVLFLGGSGNDSVIGTRQGDRLDGNGGDDILHGLAGNDFMYGGDGNDYLNGGFDNDYLSGGNGVDTLEGGQGNDILYGDNGNDRLFGGDGNDFLHGGAGSDVVYGGAGIDTAAFGLYLRAGEQTTLTIRKIDGGFRVFNKGNSDALYDVELIQLNSGYGGNSETLDLRTDERFTGLTANGQEVQITLVGMAGDGNVGLGFVLPDAG